MWNPFSQEAREERFDRTEDNRIERVQRRHARNAPPPDDDDDDD